MKKTTNAISDTGRKESVQVTLLQIQDRQHRTVSTICCWCQKFDHRCQRCVGGGSWTDVFDNWCWRHLLNDWSWRWSNVFHCLLSGAAGRSKRLRSRPIEAMMTHGSNYHANRPTSSVSIVSPSLRCTSSGIKCKARHGVAARVMQHGRRRKADATHLSENIQACPSLPPPRCPQDLSLILPDQELQFRESMLLLWV